VRKRRRVDEKAKEVGYLDRVGTKEERRREWGSGSLEGKGGREKLGRITRKGNGLASAERQEARRREREGSMKTAPSLPPSLPPSPPYCCMSCQTASRHWTKMGEASPSTPGAR
jgi:hypothetical protein